MISRITGRVVERRESSVILDVNGIGYELLVPAALLDGLTVDTAMKTFVTYHYVQSDPSRSIPVLIGFANEVEKEFFEKFITVSGIGPKAAVRALAAPIPDIARAIDTGDSAYLKKLPGIGPQRAREIVAKLQGKIGKFGLIQSAAYHPPTQKSGSEIEEEALSVLLQLQYKRPEAELMIHNALARNPAVKNSEELLNEVYRQKYA